MAELLEALVEAAQREREGNEGHALCLLAIANLQAEIKSLRGTTFTTTSSSGPMAKP